MLILFFNRVGVKFVLFVHFFFFTPKSFKRLFFKRVESQKEIYDMTEQNHAEELFFLLLVYLNLMVKMGDLL